MRIWKFPLKVADDQIVKMPPGSKILTVQRQGAQACLWALVDESLPETLTEFRKIAIYATGELLPADPGIYISTLQSEEFGLVFHAFDRSPVAR
jgi:hypothetical protein